MTSIYQVPPAFVNEPIIGKSPMRDVSKTLYSAATAAVSGKDTSLSTATPLSSSGTSITSAPPPPANPKVTPTGPPMTKYQSDIMLLFWIVVGLLAIYAMYRLGSDGTLGAGLMLALRR